MLIFKESSASTDSLYAKSYNGLNKQKWMIQNNKLVNKLAKTGSKNNRCLDVDLSGAVIIRSCSDSQKFQTWTLA